MAIDELRNDNVAIDISEITRRKEEIKKEKEALLRERKILEEKLKNAQDKLEVFLTDVNKSTESKKNISDRLINTKEIDINSKIDDLNEENINDSKIYQLNKSIYNKLVSEKNKIISNQKIMTKEDYEMLHDIENDMEKLSEKATLLAIKRKNRSKLISEKTKEMMEKETSKTDDIIVHHINSEEVKSGDGRIDLLSKEYIDGIKKKSDSLPSMIISQSSKQVDYEPSPAPVDMMIINESIEEEKARVK